ncbi:MAG: DUF4382 domain-containing protein [Nitrososphaeria archaeon]|nr:DUF4382 domain-containing protein [Nitrososphaeria archaeon]
MSSKKNIIVSGFIALAAAIIIIAASMFAGIAPHQIQTSTTSQTAITSPTTQYTTSTVTQPTSTYTTSPTGTVTQTSTITYTTTSPTVGKGILSILLTDPPRLAEGVTAVYINYSKIGIHYNRPNVGEGWIWTEFGGVNLNLTALDGIAQVLDSIEIENGTYINLIRFNITGAKVEYNGINYTAFVRTGNLTVTIIGGLEITEGSNGIIVDIQPTVFNMGTADEPYFILTAVSKGYPVPEEGLEELRDHMHVPGFKFMLRDRFWWQRLRQMHASSIEIESANISHDKLSVKVKNTGEGDVMLRLVVVAPINMLPPVREGGYIPQIFVGAAIFLVKEDGTLQPLQLRYKQNMGEDAKSMFMVSRGYKLTQNSSVELKYEGKLVFEYGLRLRDMPSPVLLGNKYLVAVIGDGVADSIIVEAK